MQRLLLCIFLTLELAGSAFCGTPLPTAFHENVNIPIKDCM